MDKKIGAIANGVIIDHIPQGNAWMIIKLLQLAQNYSIGIGLNLVSNRLGIKDLVKIENYQLTELQINLLGVFAYGATYSIIENYQIKHKTILTLPNSVDNIIVCPNHRCVSHQHRSRFMLKNTGENLIATCYYCEHNYDLRNLTDFNL